MPIADNPDLHSRLLRYCARPFALDRLRELDAEHLYERGRPSPGGTGRLRLTPLQSLDRLAALVPSPRIHRHRYFVVPVPTTAHWKYPRQGRAAEVGRLRKPSDPRSSRIAYSDHLTARKGYDQSAWL